ncbi:MAG: hypothetical protein CUN56_03595 [Phototrophicales bacterium]|nr:MAG: hypothetical protein CUN56_03595 [Phototrophicales bacterium]RMG73156.1 MAG: hypothetical protein D6711_11405 [Chloroflexota bacterium]
MFKRISLVLLMLIMAGCQATGDSKDDAAAAQSFFPDLAGYTVSNTDNIQDAITTTLTGAGISTGNLLATGVILQVDNFIDCYREVGAFDARIYVEDPSADMIQEGLRPPRAGVLVIINQDRAIENLLPCLTQPPSVSDAFSAQAAQPQPCFGNGEFQFEGDTIRYIYAATDRPLCAAWESHFMTYKTG